MSNFYERLTINTYNIAIHHCLAANAAAEWKREKPSRDTVGQMHNGPIKRNMAPTAPVAPITISNRAAHIMAPWICTAHQHNTTKP